MSATIQNVRPVEHRRAARVLLISGGVSDPSSTRMLGDRIAQRSLHLLGEAGFDTAFDVIELAALATDIARSIVSGFATAPVKSAMETLSRADAIIAATPVYKAGISGLFKSFIDLVENDLLIAKPVILAATAGSSRHAMVTDDQMRPLFAFLRAMPVPTSIFAAPEDWNSGDLAKRIDRAAGELVQLHKLGVASAITEAGWGAYQHGFDGLAAKSERDVDDINFDTDLMRLATGERSMTHS